MEPADRRARVEREVLDPERRQVVDADRAPPQPADQLGAEVAPAGHRDQLEPAVVALGVRIEDPLAAEDLRVLHDDVDDDAVLGHHAVDDRVEVGAIDRRRPDAHEDLVADRRGSGDLADLDHLGGPVPVTHRGSHGTDDHRCARSGIDTYATLRGSRRQAEVRV